ncbi:MAG: tetratricopeptide repeat protein [Planctomycetes bacterium]|nr:tetratricopeptide repeat protein [Planctomycetota bacterium]
MDLSKHLQNAAEAVKRRNYPFAVNLYSQLLALQPDNGEARAGLRQALFQKAAAKAPSRASAIVAGGVHLVVAGIARAMGKHLAAAKAYERYLVHDPLSEGANLGLGTCLEKAGCRNSALAVYRAFAEANQRCLQAARKAGELLYEAGQLDAALAMYEQALRVDPRDQESLKARKNLAAEGALRSSGIATAKSSRDLVKDKDEQRRLETAKRLQLTPEELAKARSEMEGRLAAAPDDPALLAQAADLAEKAGDYAAAVAAAERLERLAPGDPQRLRRLGDLKLRAEERRVAEAEASGDAAKAAAARKTLTDLRVAEFKRRVGHNPTDLGLRLDLGTALLASGRVDESIAELQQAVKDPKRKAEALLALGRAFRGKGLVDLAIGQFEKALDAVGGSAAAKAVLYELGSLCEESGKFDLALKHFGRVLEQDIGFQDVASRVETLKARLRA